MAVVVVLAILTFVSLASLWGTWRGFADGRRANASLSAAEAAIRGGSTTGADVGFAEWLGGRLPEHAEFSIRAAGEVEATYQWMLFRLWPRVAVEDRDAHWVVFLGLTPEAAGYRRDQFVRVLEYGPGRFVAERR
ncbi:MAG: hypothetical protein QOH76_2114 [Thermoleophilaceae bacterium]|nr:hypothetical protein [Thermoleophilaceae bacterium]